MTAPKRTKRSSTAKARPRSKPTQVLSQHYHQGHPGLWHASDAKHIPHALAIGNQLWLVKSAWQEPAFSYMKFATFLKKASVADLKQELKYQGQTLAHFKMNVEADTNPYMVKGQESMRDAISRLKAEISKRGR